MDTVIDQKSSDPLDLNNIRFQLIRLEDTIIFHLIERVQFPLNKTIYQPGAIKLDAADSTSEPDDSNQDDRPNSSPNSLSFMDWYLREQERLQSLIRRYEAPDEYPFFPAAIRKPLLKPIKYPTDLLHTNDVNVNSRIRAMYVDQLLPSVCPDYGHDRGEEGENYGSSATCDIACLQALSRRIHYGKFVAESKFRSHPDKYTALVRAGDREGVGRAITNEKVEEQVLARLALKARMYGRDPSTDPGLESNQKINVDAVVSMYRDHVIPLTKIVEVEYLMQRVDT